MSTRGGVPAGNRDTVDVEASTEQPPQSVTRLRTRSGTQLRADSADADGLIERLMAENCALRQRLEQLSRYRHLAYRDDLTGLHNRRYFEERLAQEWSRQQRFGAPVAVVVIDLDDLKRINDTAGHRTGDAVLRWLGRFLRDGCRDIDIPCRIGGDEFAIILASTDAAGAQVVLARLLHQLDTAPDQPPLPAGRRIGFSAGIAATPSAARSPADLLARADAAMYAHKRRRKAAAIVAA